MVLITSHTSRQTLRNPATATHNPPAIKPTVIVQGIEKIGGRFKFIVLIQGTAMTQQSIDAPVFQRNIGKQKKQLNLLAIGDKPGQRFHKYNGNSRIPHRTWRKRHLSAYRIDKEEEADNEHGIDERKGKESACSRQHHYVGSAFS